MSQPTWPPAQWPAPPPPRRDVRGPWRALIFILVLGAVPAVGLYLAHRAAATRADEGQPVPAVALPPAGEVVTPLASLRRVPATVANTLATETLVASLAPVGDLVAPGSCLVVGLDGTPVFDRAGGTSVIPASNMKIVTAAVALDVLGAEHRFTTEARADASPAGGVLNGNLYLVGGGDPVLGTAPYVAAAAAQVNYPQPYVTPLEALADQIVATGVRQITGSVLGDDSRYDAERFVPSWPASYATSREAGPLGALMVNDSAATLDPLRSADDPAVSAAATLTALLRERGVTVAGEAGRVVAPPVAPVVTSIQSRPLGELVGELLTTSDDNSAELLVKEIGVAAGGGGTRAAGLAVVQAKLGEWGVPLDGIFLIDGSGLDRGNRLTCRGVAGRAPSRRRQRAGGGRAADRRPDGHAGGGVPGQPRRGTPPCEDGHAARGQGPVRFRRRRRRTAPRELQLHPEQPRGGDGRGAGLGCARSGPDDLSECAADRPARPRAARSACLKLAILKFVGCAYPGAVPDPTLAPVPDLPWRPCRTTRRQRRRSRCFPSERSCSLEPCCRCTCSSRGTASSSRTAWPASRSSAWS